MVTWTSLVAVVCTLVLFVGVPQVQAGKDCSMSKSAADMGTCHKDKDPNCPKDKDPNCPKNKDKGKNKCPKNKGKNK